MPLCDFIRRIRFAFVAFVMFVTSGCAGYSATVREAQADLRAGRTDAAMLVINDRLEVERPEDIPENLKKNRLLLLLERATLLQAMGEYELAARDMMAVDQRMEWLDLDGAKSADLGKYLYSGSATPYRAPAYERMLLNTLNMVNFLAMGDMQGAKVEARRFNLLEQFFADFSGNGDALVPELLAVGNFLGGVAFEGGRDYSMAARYYSRAWAYGFRPDWFREQLIDLVRLTGYQPRGSETEAMEEITAAASKGGRMRVSEYRGRYITGNAIIVVQTGLVPYKVPERLPIGAALTYSTHHHRHHMSSEEIATANRLAVAGALKWVNFPRLTEGSPGPGGVTIAVDGQAVKTSPVANVAEQVRVAWDDVAGALIGAAILRMVTRAVAGGATRAGTRAYAESNDAPVVGVLGWLAGVAVEGALAAADTPDTRSWTTLPATIYVARQRFEPGTHSVEVTLGGRTDTRATEILEDQLKVLNFSRVR